MSRITMRSFFFFFNDTATTEIYTLSLHDALPIYLIEEKDTTTAVHGQQEVTDRAPFLDAAPFVYVSALTGQRGDVRSEEHTSELQSQSNLVCRLLLEKKKEPASVRFPRRMQHIFV